ncbi:hypothetical protein SAMN05216533_7539 [Streptomyces sp. Ag109_O5-10]|nr:hypothetical protein SAMN05216533_7539 [Streptomyces sp. Ag109_O5-10]
MQETPALPAASQNAQCGETLAKAFLEHMRAPRSCGILTCFSVGHTVTEPARHAIRAPPEQVWHPAPGQDDA